MSDVLGEADEKRLFVVMCGRCGASPPGEALWQRYRSWLLNRRGGIFTTLDRALLAVARQGRAGAWLASAYSGRFARRSALRRREVALLAVLECHIDTVRILDTSTGRGPGGAWMSFIGWGAVEALGVVLSLPFFGPIHLCGGNS